MKHFEHFFVPNCIKSIKSTAKCQFFVISNPNMLTKYEICAKLPR